MCACAENGATRQLTSFPEVVGDMRVATLLPIRRQLCDRRKDVATMKDESTHLRLFLALRHAMKLDNKTKAWSIDDATGQGMTPMSRKSCFMVLWPFKLR